MNHNALTLWNFHCVNSSGRIPQTPKQYPLWFSHTVLPSVAKHSQPMDQDIYRQKEWGPNYANKYDSIYKILPILWRSSSTYFMIHQLRLYAEFFYCCQTLPLFIHKGFVVFLFFSFCWILFPFSDKRTSGNTEILIINIKFQSFSHRELQYFFILLHTIVSVAFQCCFLCRFQCTNKMLYSLSLLLITPGKSFLFGVNFSCVSMVK